MRELILKSHQRVDFLVVSSTLAEDLRPLVRWRRVPVPARPFPVKFSMFFLLAGLRYRRSRVDLVQTLGAIMPRRADIVSVHFCHAEFSRRKRRDPGPPVDSALRRLNDAISFFLGFIAERWYFSWRAGTATAVSPGQEQELRRNYPALPVVVVPNGVEHARLLPDDGIRRRTRAEERVPDDEVIALFVGSRWEHKGLLVAIEALSMVKAETGTPVSLWVIGHGDVDRYRAVAARAGVGDRVRFFGFAADTTPFYRAADVFVLPSVYETFCMAAHEAASAGLPIVGTAVSGVTDLIDGDAGMLVERRPAPVAEALTQLARSRRLRLEMGSRARQRVASFTWEAAADRTVALYERLLSPTGEAAVMDG